MKLLFAFCVHIPRLELCSDGFSHTHTLSVYLYIYVCVCVCVFIVCLPQLCAGDDSPGTVLSSFFG